MEQAQRKLAQVNALLGGVLLTSDDPAGYSPTAREQYRALRELSRAERSRDRVVKRSEKDSLYAAMDVSAIWLERALSGQ